jgi:hypothetical protein
LNKNQHSQHSSEHPATAGRRNPGIQPARAANRKHINPKAYKNKSPCAAKAGQDWIFLQKKYAIQKSFSHKPE